MSQSSSGNRAFQLAAPEKVAEIWKVIRPLVLRLLERAHGKHTERGVFEKIVQGQFQLWLAFSHDNLDGMALTHFEEWETGLRTLFVEGCAGERADLHLESAMQSIEDYARLHGCIDVCVIGRKGWVRKLPAYQLTHVTLRKIL